jgi:hypothetical protein
MKSIAAFGPLAVAAAQQLNPKIDLDNGKTREQIGRKEGIY